MLLLPEYDTASLPAEGSVKPGPLENPVTVPGFAVELIFTLSPLVALNVILPPALISVTPAFVIVTAPVGPLVEIPPPGIILFATALGPSILTVTASKKFEAITPPSVKSKVTAPPPTDVTSKPSFLIGSSSGTGPGVDQVPSPLKYVLLDGVPVADITGFIVPVVVNADIGSPP